MSLYAISDLHLSTGAGTDKSMEVFGRRWLGYTEKLEKNWRAVICNCDTVVIPGDISWALTPEEAESDMMFLDRLPGKKLIGKGNHDFWWSTAKKLGEMFERIGTDSISLLYNNAYDTGDFICAGTRGWYNDESLKMPPGTDYGKLVNRENERLKISLDAAQKLGGNAVKPLLCFFHFPPVRGDFVCRPLIDTLHAYNVSRCYYGHIHGDYAAPRTADFEGISFTVISADYLGFSPMPLFI